MNISIITYGCTYNQADSLKIKELLNTNENSFVSNENADVIIVNTCAVKHTTETKTMHFLKKVTKKFPKTKFIITGCLPQISIEIFEQIRDIISDNNGLILHPRNIHQIVDLIDNNKIYQYQDEKIKASFDKAKINPFLDELSKNAIIQISEGCDNNCSYCCTTNARGNLVSFDFDSILFQIKFLLNKGVKELYLSSQDLGNYEYQGKNIIDLCQKISEIPGNYRIRLGMINPQFLIKYIKDFMLIFKDKRFYRFLHIPIQSGSNYVLKKMRRKYCIEDVNEIFSYLKKFDKNFSFSTDVIVGFPSETNNDFNLTKDWIEKWHPEIINISKFTPRPNTDAKNMKQLDSKIIKNRSKELTSIYNNYLEKYSKKWIGWTGEVFINKINENLKYKYGGRNIYYISIISNQGKIWKMEKIKIYDFLNHSYIGKKI